METWGAHERPRGKPRTNEPSSWPLTIPLLVAASSSANMRRLWFLFAFNIILSSIVVLQRERETKIRITPSLKTRGFGWPPAGGCFNSGRMSFFLVYPTFSSSYCACQPVAALSSRPSFCPSSAKCSSPPGGPFCWHPCASYRRYRAMEQTSQISDG